MVPPPTTRTRSRFIEAGLYGRALSQAVSRSYGLRDWGTGGLGDWETGRGENSFPPVPHVTQSPSHLISATPFPQRILSLTASDSGNARKSSTFAFIERTPGLGQSVPQRHLSARSSRRGRYSRSFFGGIPDRSRWTLACRRARKAAVGM